MLSRRRFLPSLLKPVELKKCLLFRHSIVAHTLTCFASPHIQETSRLMQEPVPGITACPDEHNARYFHVSVHGPKDVSVWTWKRLPAKTPVLRSAVSIFSIWLAVSVSVWRRNVQARVVPAWRIPNGCPKSSFYDQNLSSEHRQTRKDLLGHLERYVHVKI